MAPHEIWSNESQERYVLAVSAEDFEPRIDGQPHTAPIYDAHNTQIQTMPYPVACVKNADKCTCYTEQATPISGFDKGQCLDFVKNGIYNPYKRQTAENAAPAVQAAPVPQAPAVIALDAKSKQSLMFDGYNESRIDMQ